MADNEEPKEPSGAEKMFGDFAPALVGFTDNVLFGQVWTRPQLSRATNSVGNVISRGSTRSTGSAPLSSSRA